VIISGHKNELTLFSGDIYVMLAKGVSKREIEDIKKWQIKSGLAFISGGIY